MTCSSWLSAGVLTQSSPFFELVALVDEQRGVAAVVDDELRAVAARMRERLRRCTTSILRASRPSRRRRERRRRRWRRRRGPAWRRCCSCPAHGGAEVDQRLDQHGGLDGHVQRAGDAHAGERLRRRVLGADGHQAGHLLLGDGDFFAAPVGERDVGDFVVGGGRGGGLRQSCGHGGSLAGLKDIATLKDIVDGGYPETGPGGWQRVRVEGGIRGSEVRLESRGRGGIRKKDAAD